MIIEFLPLKILDYIEDLTKKYNLDKDQGFFSSAKNTEERQLIRFLIYKNDYAPSWSLKKIIKNYINQNLSFSQLENEIKEALSIEKEIAIQIAQDIVQNNSIKLLLNNPEADIDMDMNIIEDINNTEKKPLFKKGISQELE